MKLVSKKWEKTRIDQPKHDQNALVNNFKSFFEELEKKKIGGESIKKCADIFKSHTVLNSVSLLDVKTNLNSIKKQMVDLLKTSDSVIIESVIDF